MIIYDSEQQFRNAIAARSQFKSHNQQKTANKQQNNRTNSKKKPKQKVEKNFGHDFDFLLGSAQWHNL